MLKRAWPSLWPLLASALCCVPLAWAGPPQGAVDSPAAANANVPANVPASVDARGWLTRMQSAARERNYQGTMVFTAGDVVSSSKVGHYCVGEQYFERVEALDGRQQRIYRHNDLVHAFWPQSRVATAERRDPVAESLLLPDVEPRMQDHYELRVLGIDRIAGRAAHVLHLKPRDDLRFAQRLWADAETGLMLRADVLGPQGTVLESSAFTEVAVDVKPQRETVLGPMKKLDGYRVVKVESQRTQLEAEGWVLGSVPAGFRLLGCVRRPIDMPPPDAAVSAAPVLQAVFSDGLTRVSIFIEPYDPTRPRQPVWTQMGATHTLMKPRAERWWVTVMGDVPAATLKSFMSALERRP